MRILSAGLLTAAATLTLASPATAQFIMRPFPAGWQNYGIYQRSYGFYAPSPTGGYGFQFRRTYEYRTTGLAALPVAPLNAAIAQQSIYAAATGAGRPLNDRQQIALQQAQRANRAGVDARQQAVDRVAAVPRDVIEQGAPEVQAALAMPTERDLLSGAALNRVLRAIHELEDKGVRANAPFLPPELLAQVVYDGGVAADVLNLFAEDKLHFPAALLTRDTEPLRAAMQADFELIGQQLRSGKKSLDTAPLDRLAENARKLNGLHPGAETQDCGCEYLVKLEAAVKWLKQNPGVIVTDWYTIGTGVGSLTKHMARYKLEFGPALATDDGAYASLFRGLTTYLADLLAAKR